MKAKSTRVKLTDRFVKSATTDARKSPIFMDDEVIGFGVQVRETGRKSFTLDYMFEFGIHIFLGGAFAMRTVGAMIIRSAVWVMIAASTCRALRCFQRGGSGPA